LLPELDAETRELSLLLINKRSDQTRGDPQFARLGLAERVRSET